MPFEFRGTYDENWPLPETLSMDEYRRVFFRPDAHFVDGRVIQRHLGSVSHGSTVGRLIGLFDSPLREKGSHLCVSLRLQVSPTRMRVCDFVALDPNAPHETVPTFAPLVCAEVLESGQSVDDEIETLSDYIAMGVRHIWLVDPEQKKLFTFSEAGLSETDELRLSAPRICVTAEDVFAPDD